MGDVVYLIAKIFGYTIVIICLILISKKTIIPYMLKKNMLAYKDKKILLKEKIQINRDSYLILVEYNGKEMLVAVSPNTIKTIIMSEIGEVESE